MAGASGGRTRPTPPGVELVEDHLDRLEYGIYA